MFRQRQWILQVPAVNVCALCSLDRGTSLEKLVEGVFFFVHSCGDVGFFRANCQA